MGLKKPKSLKGPFENESREILQRIYAAAQYYYQHLVLIPNYIVTYKEAKYDLADLSLAEEAWWGYKAISILSGEHGGIRDCYA